MFADVSSLIARNLPAANYGVAVADVDGDGENEFIVSGYEGPNRVWKWAHGGLIDVTPPALADPGAHTVCCAAGDIDGDGREELFFMHADTFSGPKARPDRLLDREADGRWRDLFQHVPPTLQNRVSGRSVASIDRRGTGRYGFAVSNYAAPMRLYEQRPDGVLVDVATSLGLAVPVGGRTLWAGPLLSERSDLLHACENGPNALFVNDARGNFRDVAEAVSLLDAKENARGLCVFDADDDGRLDLALGNWDGPNRLFVRQPDGSFKNRATPAMALPGPVRTVLAADFDNDGREELFFNFLGESNRLFRYSTGEVPWKLADAGDALETEGFGTGAAYADIDGDGALELLIAHGERAPQKLGLFKVPGAEKRHWLRVKPLTRFGAPARGALVRLTAGGCTQVRVIDGGSGYLCQMEPVAHFGLGNLDRIDGLRIAWPDGASLELGRTPIRTNLVVPYPGT